MKRLLTAVCLLLTLSACGNSTTPDTAPDPASPVAEAPPAEAPTTPGQSPAPDDEGFIPLRLADFEPFQGVEGTWREEEGLIKCSGTPKGYLHSRETYRNFTWKGEFLFVPVADESPLKYNTGFMLHIQEPHKVWPRSLEVQGRFDEMAQVKSNGGVPPLSVNDDPAARETARQPLGSWNAIEIISRDGSVTSLLNGQRVCTSELGELIEGEIGLQSELFEVHFRNLRIRRD